MLATIGTAILWGFGLVIGARLAEWVREIGGRLEAYLERRLAVHP